MPKLIIQDQTGAVAPQSYRFKSGSIVDILTIRQITAYADTDRLYLNGQEIDIVECDLGIGENYKLACKPLGDGDVVTLIQEVKGIIGDALSLVGDVVQGAFSLLGLDLTPDIPEIDTNRGSPNNAYQSQTNVIRAFAQRPLVCGSPRIYPDLIGEAIEFYNSDGVKVSEQVFEAAFGDLQGGTVYAANTPINGNNFIGSTVERFQPVNETTTVTDYRLGVSVDEVDGQTIRGTNEGTLGTTYTLTDGTTAATYGGTTFTFYVAQTTDTDQMKTDFDNGDFSVVQVDYTATRPDENGNNFPEAVSGNGTVASITLQTNEYQVVVNNFNGPRSTNNVYNLFTQLGVIVSSSIGPFPTPINAEKFFFNIIYRQGLDATVDFSVTFYELDGQGGNRTGNNQTITFSQSASEPNTAQQITQELRPSRGRQWYEFEIQRTSEESQDTQVPDVPTLEAVYCIQELGDTDFNNATMLRITLQSTQLPTAGGVDNRINIRDAQMSMPSYDVDTETITANAPSRDFADAILHIVRDFYGRDPENLIDLDTLYTLRNRVIAINPEFARFDFTFDDASQSLGERIDICCNVARISKYWDGTRISFWRDEATTPKAVLGRADIAQESDRDYSFTRQFYITGNKESVQVEFINRTQNKPNYIYRTIEADGTIVNTAGENPKTISLLGCQSEANAINRANLEIRKIFYNHTTITDTFLKAQIDRSRGDVILYNELYETGDEFGGIITGINGNNATTDNLVTLDPSNTYQVYFTNDIGAAVGPQAVTANGPRGFTATDLSQAYAPDNNNQLGSRYYITETNEFEKAMYRVLDKQTRGNYVQLTCLNYDARTYEMD